MKKHILNYSAPAVEMFEVLAECGFGNSTVTLPGFGVEDNDDLIVAPTPTANNE